MPTCECGKQYLELTTTNGKKFLIHNEDVERIVAHPWEADKSGHINTRLGLNRASIGMHRVLINAHAGQLVDHINQNPADNRKCNLRFLDKSKNAINVTRYNKNQKEDLPKGVVRTAGKVGSPTGRFRVEVWHNHKRNILGTGFTDPVEAGKVRQHYDQELLNSHVEPDVKH